MNTKLKFHAERRWMNNRINLQLSSHHNDKVALACNITFKEIEPEEYNDECLLKLKPDEAQDLMDVLYAAGIRPSQAAGSAGQLDAVKYHLEDMRTLVLREKQQ